MLTKDSLRKQFSSNYKEYYEVPLFQREGFERRLCLVCGKGFWTAGDKEVCGDSDHEQYTFFRDNPRKESYASFWKKTADFWKRNNHEVISRYPVLSRWRDDLPFTIASIVDFQRLEAGKVVFEYPANPLFVPQMCLRFPDVANVGVTGRHFTCFMMAGQHSFGGKGYWKEECIEYNYKYLREVLEIPKSDITYGEDVWNMPDFSSFGPSIESFSHGSELVNSVFMQFRQANSSFSELETKVIDVGWGFERLLWHFNGNLSAYDAVFPREVEYMKQRASIDLSPEVFKAYASLSASLDVETVMDYNAEKKKIANELGLSLEELEKGVAPLQGVYAIADHSRALLFALTDGALPSNTSGGYNLRVLARRAFSFINKYNFEFSLFDLCAMHAEDLKEVFPELTEELEHVKVILAAEECKYKESVEKARRIAGEELKKAQSISLDRMITLYESHGVNPEMLEQVGKEQGLSPTIPTHFYSELTKRRVMEKERADSVTGKKVFLPDLDTSVVQPTRLLFYEDVDLVSCTAKLVGWHRNALIFDQTVFYPEGGGQMNDAGKVTIGEFPFNVVDVHKQGKVVLHFVEEEQVSSFSELKRGQSAVMQLNLDRRKAIMKHHSATHMLLGTCRDYFGSHVWQSGSKKDEDEAHLDITHFEKPSLQEVQEIERRVNKAIASAIPITVLNLPRKQAEEAYGMRVYQGSGAVSDVLRIINIKNVDTEACGGTHCHNTADLGFFKIKSVEQVQDGVIRFRYCASLAALAYIQEQEKLLEKTSSVFSAPRQDLPRTATRFFEEWKEQRKKLAAVNEELASGIAREQIFKHANDKKVELSVDFEPILVERIADQIGREEDFVAIIYNKGGFCAVAANEKSGVNAAELLRSLGVKGGGSQRFARGKRV
ncbi:alanine--tRNA ligase [Candidatus Micrarchaeota archaeon]|nr:alanine--tRNA ligase [Candidatus Micrarchaeota archaeon]